MDNPEFAAHADIPMFTTRGDISFQITCSQALQWKLEEPSQPPLSSRANEATLTRYRGRRLRVVEDG